MSRKKLVRFQENDQRSNIIQDGKELYTQIKGNWDQLYFKNQKPIVVELGCGRGEYTTGLAAVFPEKNFIGVDIKGSRLWKGSSIAIEKELHNVAFLRTYIQNLDHFFAENEIAEIWITFPDPRPRGKDEKRRLTSPRFMLMYRTLLREKGMVHFKTDNFPLFEYTLQEVLPELKVENLKYTEDLSQSPLNELHFGIQTKYEKLFSEKGFKINYMQFNFPSKQLPAQ